MSVLDPSKEDTYPYVVFDVMSHEMLEYFVNQPTTFEKRSIPLLI